MTKIEILEEAIQNLSGKSRIFISQYYIDEQRQCAVGHCLKNPENLLDAGFNQTAIANLLKDKIISDKDFKPEYRGHEAKFWEDIQKLNDGQSFWDESGELSKSGKEFKLTLLERYESL